MLTLACGRLLDYPGRRHCKLAAAVEFIHTATLLHDDVVAEFDEHWASQIRQRKFQMHNKEWLEVVDEDERTRAVYDLNDRNGTIQHCLPLHDQRFNKRLRRMARCLNIFCGNSVGRFLEQLRAAAVPEAAVQQARTVAQAAQLLFVGVAEWSGAATCGTRRRTQEAPVPSKPSTCMCAPCRRKGWRCATGRRDGGRRARRRLVVLRARRIALRAL